MIPSDSENQTDLDNKVCKLADSVSMVWQVTNKPNQRFIVS